MTKPRYPTPEEVHALERAARQARAEEVARLTRAALAGIRALFSPDGVKGARHA